MCGIAGTLSFGEFRVTADYVTRMRETLVHRGPDGAGTWVDDDGRIGLGARRLAILDLSEAAEQPLANEDGKVRIAYNGEIYNHAELRRELERTHTFRTDHSDTETIVHAFEEWGIDCLHRLRGMFALALWDGRRRELWLARDRIGIKPLYWSAHHGRLVFASEIKALLEDPDQERTIDEEALYHYLSFLTAPAPRTLFRGISKLEPGTWLRARADGTIEQRRWWEVWEQTQPLVDASEEEIARRLLAELRTSVRLRKLSDRPVGVFLSGGLDSSTNAALFSEGESGAVKTFAIGYEGENPSYPNEFDWARKAAAHVGAEHHERVLTQRDLIDFLPRMARLQDEPVADPVAVPLYFVSALARDEGVVVAQAGEGSDELFLGYPRWRTLLRVQRAAGLPVPRAVKRGGIALLPRSGRPYEALRRDVRGEPVFWAGAEAFTEAQKRRLLSPRLRRELDGLTSWDALAPIRRRFEELAWEPSPLHWMTYVDLNLRLPELLLARIDKMSMGASVEARVPFLDQEVVALALSIPSRVKENSGELKHILKRAVRGLLPGELVDRPKQGFRVPVDDWMSGALGETVRREVSAFCRETDLLDPQEVERLLRRPGRNAWYLLDLALWHKEFIAC